MSNAVNWLTGIAGAYTEAVIDASLVRQYLRVLRKRSFSSSRKAAKAAGISASTTAKIENMKLWPVYDPGIGLVLKLLHALKKTPADFVAELDSLDRRFIDEASRAKKSLPLSAAESENPPANVTSKGEAHVQVPSVAPPSAPPIGSSDSFRIGREIAAAFLGAIGFTEGHRPPPSRRAPRSRRKTVRRRRRPPNT